jgi:hypothetical protein
MPRSNDPIKSLAFWLKLAKNIPLMGVLRRGAGVERRESAIKTACDAFGLDVENQQDRNLLLGILADTHFPVSPSGINALACPKRRGAPLKWTKAKEEQLISDMIAVCPKEPPYPDSFELAALLMEKFNTKEEKRYPYAEETLAKYLRHGLPGRK